MSNDLVRSKLEKSLSSKSLSDLVRKTVCSRIYLLIDVSGSMSTLLRNGKPRITGLREVVNEVSSQTVVKMIAFGGNYSEQGSAYFTHYVPDPAGSTPLHAAIDLVRSVVTDDTRVVVISDGEPNDPIKALDAARKFGKRIDVVYVGDLGGEGEDFLRRLAAMCGGTEFHGDLSEPKQLGNAVIGLLQSGN